MLEMGSNDLAAFFNTHWKDERLFSKPDTLELVSAGIKRNNDLRNGRASLINYIDFPQPCLPSFPFKEGWLVLERHEY
jgi:hypothetical protein